MIYTIILATCVGLILHDGSTFNGYIETLALLAGFANAFFTTKRSRWFIIPDYIWLVLSIYLLIASDVTNASLSVYYGMLLVIGAVQFYTWSVNVDDNKKVVLVRKRIKCNIMLVILTTIFSLVIALVVHITLPNSSNILLGSFASGFGIVGAITLALRFYMAEVLFLLSNLLNMFILVQSGLYQLALTPLVFIIYNIIFLKGNYVGKNNK